MKATIDRSGCIGCTLCTNIAPDVFRMADDGLAEVYQTPIPEGSLDDAIQAKESCPVSVIDVTEA